MAAWSLASAEGRHGAWPDTFDLAPRAARESLLPGDMAQLLFTQSDSPGERMWVRIEGMDDGGYVGVLENIPIVIADLAHGATIHFAPEHIARIERRADG